jgi:hypothetical protein
LVIGLICLAFSGCGNEGASTASDTPTTSPSENIDPTIGAEIRYAWVDKLNIRKAPNAASAVVAQVREGDALTFNGEQTETTEKINLRGKTFDEPWIKVTTTDGKTGWVYGGAVEFKTANSKAISVTIDEFGDDNWSEGAESESGCSCSFRGNKDDYKSNVFGSNLNGIASIKLNGKVLELKGGRTGERFSFYKRSFDKAWITLSERSPFLLFGEKIDTRSDDWYNETREELVKTLLVMDELPRTIPIEKVGQIGMGTSAEFRDMTQEALEMAKKEQEKGNTGVPAEWVFRNADFECHIIGNVDGKNDSGGDTYAGEMVIKSRDGTVLAKQKIWGDCAC